MSKPSKILLLILLCFYTITSLLAQNTINLEGEWQVQLDNNNEWVNKGKVEGTINLPGSLAENGFGYQTEGSDFGILTPEYKYIGKALYLRTLTIPAKWKNKEIVLFLERVLWESRVFIDGKEVSVKDALGTPHVHNLGKLLPGDHEIAVQVNNEMMYNIGDKGHAYSDYTQGIWNGIVGRIELWARDPTHFISNDIYSDINTQSLTIHSKIIANQRGKTNFIYEVKSVKTGDQILSGEFSKSLEAGESNFQFVIPTEGKLKLWSEFMPEVYSLSLKLKQKNNEDRYENEFGFYEITHDGTKIQINNTPVFLRGNLDCVHFPLTGYPSCDLQDWIDIFKIYKEHGFNHVRFHSWCPPEAAFQAANRLGIYIQAEASVWIDWWMSQDNAAKGRPEMNTKGFPKGLGYNPVRDNFVVAEMNRVITTYGNHPSLAMFCIGNELGNSDFEKMKTWVAELKGKDPRRLYSISTARTITDVDDFNVTHYINGVGRTRGLNGAKTNWDFEHVYGVMNIPILAHEIGQWPVYPRWSEIDKYTGVFKARNLAQFRKEARKNGIADQSDDFADASGALNQLMYKYEIESFLRTPSCAGIQLLSMQDYQGQGEALIGWLDSHWDSKDITTPEKFKKHNNPTVPLARFDKYVWENNEKFWAKIQVSHHAARDLTDKVLWKIIDNENKVFKKGIFNAVNFENGSITDVGEINTGLDQLPTAQQLKLIIELDSSGISNEWDLWVYPHKLPENKQENIILSNKLDDALLEQLASGAKVLLNASNLGTDETSVKALFYPLYWSLTFFPGQGKTNIGLLLKEQHKAFTDFPTEYHSNWQWESISDDAKGFILNDLPHGYRPIAQPVDDFHRNNKIGSVFELQVGQGKLLVCGYNIDAEKPVARQLKYSLLNYMHSIDFHPEQNVSQQWLKQTFKTLKKAEIVNQPKEFEDVVLMVEAGALLNNENTLNPWKMEMDNVQLNEVQGYQLEADGVWKEEDHSGWVGKNMELTIHSPNGMLGTLLVYFHDWNNKERSGVLDFEGRQTTLEKHPQGVWVRFHVMREDSNDGKLVLKTSTKTGPDLMIKKIVLIKH